MPIVGFTIASRDDCFGNGVDEVKIVVKDIPLASIMVMGANKDSVKISCNGIDYVKFKDADFIQQIQEDRLRTLTIMGTLNLNEWQGRESLQVFIKDYELADSYNESKYDF